MLELTTTPRVPKETKKDGSIPAVYYGAKQASTPIFINAIEFDKVFKEAGESSTISLVAGNEKVTALVQDIQRDPVKSHAIHVDFYVIEKGQKVHVKIPIVFTGESQAVKDGHVLSKVLHELSVEGDPTMLPHEFTVDIAPLVALDSVIHVSDIVLPKGVELYHIEPTEVVVGITAVVEEKEETPAAIDLDSIEVEAKGKKEEDTEGSAEGGEK
jgi:large subunit ribosomal protein L25